MNARFKFRVWSSEQKKMYFWSDCVRITNFIYGMFVDHRMLGRGSWNIEQCTGLKDKNGRLIYEGDIVKEIILDEDSAFGREFEEKSVVCFGGGDYPCSFTMKSKRFYKGFALLGYGINRIEIEVIGNIHENPELLEEEE